MYERARLRYQKDHARQDSDSRHKWWSGEPLNPLNRLTPPETSRHSLQQSLNCCLPTRANMKRSQSPAPINKPNGAHNRIPVSISKDSIRQAANTCKKGKYHSICAINIPCAIRHSAEKISKETKNAQQQARRCGLGDGCHTHWDCTWSTSPPWQFHFHSSRTHHSRAGHQTRASRWWHRSSTTG